MKHILLSVILIAAIMIEGTSCNIFNDEPKQNVNELALEFLEQKYGEKFEYSAPTGASYTGTRSFFATCESFGDHAVVVQIENYKDRENRVIRDNYIAVKYEDKVREFFKQISDEEFGSSKIFYNASGRVLSSELSSNASLEEYFSSRDGMITAVISLPESGYENFEQIKRLYEKISNTIFCDEVSVLIIVVDDDIFGSADEDELRNLFIAESGVAQARLDRYDGETKLDRIVG